MGYICTSILNKGTMSTTTIKRKALRNRVKAKQRISSIKRLSAKPTLKNIDIEEIKKTFTTKATKKDAPKVEEAENDKTVKQEKQVVETKSPKKTEAKVEKAETKEEKVETKEEKVETKEVKAKERKLDSVKSSEKNSPNASKKPVAKKAKEE
jgi:hypothetical protein